jgi:hypothetical protein
MLTDSTRKILPSRFTSLFVTSLAIASASFFSLRILSRLYADFALVVSFSLTVVWAVLLRVAIVRYRKQGLWVLIGAPLALFYPVVFILWMRACAHNLAACP